MGQARTERAEVKLRLNKDLKDVLEAAAERRGISLNAEIVARLENSRRPRRQDTIIYWAVSPRLSARQSRWRCGT